MTRATQIDLFTDQARPRVIDTLDLRDGSLPRVALSIRQPWAWLIVNGWKDIENRDWPTRFRGNFLIHASKGMTHDEYESAEFTAKVNGVSIPAFKDLERGGIVGVAEITDCFTVSGSPWFFGRYGFAIRNATPLPFTPMKGQLGFFNIPIPKLRGASPGKES